MPYYYRVGALGPFEMIGAVLILTGIAAEIGLLVGTVLDLGVTGPARTNLHLVYWAGLASGILTILFSIIADPWYDGQLVIRIFSTAGIALIAIACGAVFGLLAGAFFDLKNQEAAQKTLWRVFWSTFTLGAMLVCGSVAFK